MTLDTLPEPQIPFWALVRHDFKRRRAGRLRAYRAWVLAYLAAVCVIFIALATYVGRIGDFDPRPVWYTTFGLPFMCFGLGIGWTVNEWKNGTAGWWLTLPAPRTRLIASKFTAVLLRTLFIYAMVFLGITVFGLYTMAVGGHLTAQAASDFLGVGMRWYSLLLAITPLPCAFGVFHGTLTQTRLKPAIPLVWMAFGLLWWLLSTRRLVHMHPDDPTLAMAVHWTWPMLWPVVGTWILSYVLLQLAAIILERHLAM
ncbi:MAG: ABC transporter permease [Alicyclobacillus macrosporangiidus]|uniref:ABC transporter permease n=1 Tax=Alicyclobacillus macrosporangiidus TaxID=392015 RepID=UPI0026EFAF5A|nr:ABC transporter permease [Alicyclobacillus macrosporangiidus]MCL6597820.1 ABC transporter permease [Alicyclobacillus macrosporangiidus]